MAVKSRFISNKDAIPQIPSSGIFNGRSKDRFAVSYMGNGIDLSDEMDPIFQAYLRLRANVYIDQTGMLDTDVRRNDGTETDSDDERSAHFIVAENRLSTVAIIACMRLIEKKNATDRPLPIEDFFPEIFENNPVAKNSIEVSRFIVRQNEKKHRLGARAMLLVSALAYTRDREFGPTYAVVEPEFEAHLTAIDVPIERIAEPKWVSEYNDFNLGIMIDTEEMAHRMGKDAVASCLLEAGESKYWGTLRNRPRSTHEDLPEVV